MSVLDARNPKASTLPETLAGALPVLAAPFMPDPAGKAKAELLRAQTAAVQGGLAKDTAETKGIEINNQIADALMKSGIPIETDTQGRSHISAASLPGLMAKMAVLTKGSVDPSKWTDNTNAGIEADLSYQRKQADDALAAANAIKLQDNKPITGNSNGTTWPTKADLINDIATQGGTRPAPVPGGSSLASTTSGMSPASAEVVAGAGPAGEGLPTKEETDSKGFPIVEPPLPNTDLAPSSLAGTVSGVPVPSGPKYTPNSVTQPPKAVNITKTGTKPIPVAAADSIVMDSALLSQLEDLQNSLTMPKDPNDPRRAEVQANIDSFHPLAQSIPLIGKTMTDAFDPKGVPLRSRLSNMANVQLHTLSGAAVTDPEWARLSQGIANVKDWNSSIAQDKLKEAINYLRDIHLPSFGKFYNPENGYNPNTVLEPYYPKSGATSEGGVPSTMREAVSQAVKPAASGIPQGAIERLRSDPSLSGDFDEMFGSGSAAKILQGQ